MAQRKGGLGKQGLDALFQSSNDSGISADTLRVTELEPNRNQPRVIFDEQSLQELADSIKEVGVIQPIIVRTQTGGGYQIVAGERRWRAAQIAGLTEVPVIIKDLTDREMAELALIENLQREDLDAVEEAEGYRHLMSEYSMTQEQVAERVGKSRPAVANSVRLLELPKPVLELLRSGDIAAGHARALLSLPNEDDMIRVGTLAAKKGMTVREVEKTVKKEKDAAKEKKGDRAKHTPRDSYLDEVTIFLSDALCRRVKVTGNENKGTLEIDFFSVEDLRELALRLAPSEE